MQRLRRTLIIILATGISLLAVADELRIITIKSRPAQEIIPLVRPLLSPGDYVNAQGYQLIVRTSPQNLAEIEKLLAQIDKAPRMLTVTVRQVTRSESEALRQSVSGRIKAGDARVTVPDSGPRSGATVTARDGDSHVRYRVGESEDESMGTHRQMVRVMDGQRAFIHMGQSVVLGVPGYAGAPGAFLERTASNGFDVIPRTQGDNVIVEILPRLSSLRNPRTGEMDVREAGTTVRARLGEWIEIGAISDDEKSRRRHTAAGAKRQARDEWRVILKVE